jgi:hypothetical protein
MNRPGMSGDCLAARPTWPSAGEQVDLGTHGLAKASFVPPAPVRALRDLTRTRARTRDHQRTYSWGRSV